MPGTDDTSERGTKVSASRQYVASTSDASGLPGHNSHSMPSKTFDASRAQRDGLEVGIRGIRV
jgi:hypothetical protein